MSTHKALAQLEAQGPYTIAEHTIPSPGPKDVLVKVMATALNPVDWKILLYPGFISAWPFIAGTDGAGVVEQVGSEVTNVAKGDKIFFQGWFDNQRATFQQYCIVPAEITAKIPASITFDQAASIPLGLATAVAALWSHHPQAKSLNFPAPWEEGGLTRFANKPLFIIGGASSVGQYTIQIAKLQRFSPIITTASLHNEALLKSLGATHVLSRSLSLEETLAELKTITGETPFELVYDAISHADTQSLGYKALAPGGSLLIVNPEQIKDLRKPEDKKKVVMVQGSVQMPDNSNRELGVELYSRLTEWLEKGVLVPNKVEVLPNGLAGIQDGLNRLKENKVSGLKLIARPQETA